MRLARYVAYQTASRRLLSAHSRAGAGPLGHSFLKSGYPTQPHPKGNRCRPIHDGAPAFGSRCKKVRRRRRMDAASALGRAGRCEILLNLLSNACKFTKEGEGALRVRKVPFVGVMASPDASVGGPTTRSRASPARRDSGGSGRFKISV
jgi:hypothetical protein